MEVARPFRLIQHGTPVEAQAREKAKKDVSASSTSMATAENAINSPSVTDSETSSSSQTASTVDAADCESDLEELKDNDSSLQSISGEMMETAPPNSQLDEKSLFKQEWEFKAGREGLDRFLSLPPTWPLARLMLPIKYMVKQMETLLQCYCFETIATCQAPQQQKPYVEKMARDLGQLMAIGLAGSLLNSCRAC